MGKHITRLDSFVSGGTMLSYLLSYLNHTNPLCVIILFSTDTAFGEDGMFRFEVSGTFPLAAGNRTHTDTVCREGPTHSLKNAGICHFFSLKFLCLREVRLRKDISI